MWRSRSDVLTLSYYIEKNQAHKVLGHLLKVFTTVSWLYLFSQNKYNTVVILFQVKKLEKEGLLCIFYEQVLPQRMALRFMPEIMVKEPSEFGLVQVLSL